MSETHKHKGVTRSNGSLRSHPASQKHKDKQVKRYHSSAIATAARLAKKVKTSPSYKKKPSVKKATKKPTVKKSKPREEIKRLLGKTVTVNMSKSVMCPVDEDGFIMVDLSQKDLKQKGVRVKFYREFIRSGRRIRRTTGVEIEK